MHKNRIKLFSILLITITLLSCKTQQSELKGFWENENKIIEFADTYFVIYNKQATDIVALKGIYSFAQNPMYALKMTYKEAMDSNGDWFSLEDTELENYIDTLLFIVNKNSLETKVMGNGQKYFYTRINNPMENK